MSESFAASDVASLLLDAANDLESRSEELRVLDAAIGDGDLGITVQLASKAMRAYLASANEPSIGRLLAQCGMTINKASPSTFGTLLASAFLAAGKAVPDKDRVDPADLVLMGDAAVEGVKKRGKADVGEKTMLDCLVPAVEAFKVAIECGSDLPHALQQAVTAAEAGLKSTVNMQSRHGRASWHGEKTIGVQDAGATAMYYLIESLARHLH